MSDKKVIVELTTVQARALSEAHVVCPNETAGLAVVEAKGLLTAALAEHDRQQRLERYRVPWRIKDNMVCDSGGYYLTPPYLPTEQVNLLGAAPKLAEFAEKLINECRMEEDSVPDSVSYAAAQLYAALDESGWPRGGR